MTAEQPLEPLAQAPFRLAAGETDLRGAHVVDRDGKDMGTVEGLVVDTGGGTVRFLDVRNGGFFGIGEDRHLVPVEAIASFDDDLVTLREPGETVAATASYSPELVEDQPFWERAYAAYGYTPYWGTVAMPGFMYWGPR